VSQASIHAGRLSKFRQSFAEVWSFYELWRKENNAGKPWRRYAVSLAAVAAGIGIRLLLDPKLGNTSPFVPQTLTIVFAAWYGGLSAGLIATVVGTLASDYLFVDPRYTFATGEVAFRISMATFILQSVAIILLVASLRYMIFLNQERTIRLRENGDHLQALIDGITDYAIYLLDPKGYLLSWSTSATKIQGYTEDEVLGRRFSMFYLPEELSVGKPERDLKIAARLGRHEEEGWVTRRDGSAFWANRVITVLLDKRGGIRGYAHITRDMTERKQAQDLIKHQAYHDGLTGLPNRLHLQENLQLLMRWANRHDEEVAVLFLDLDRFKAINDSLGHHVGDELLKATAERIQGAIRPQDTVARQGGDEFVVTLQGIRHPGGAMRQAETVVNSLREPFTIGGRQLHIRSSVGVAIYPRDGEDVNTLLQNADAALYEAKGAGRDLVVGYSREMNAKASERLNLENELREALDRGQFRVVYQPIFSIAHGRTVSAEALLRWQHPTLGAISPAEFIPLAEESGVILELGDWVMEEVCCQQATWAKGGYEIVPVAVNLSARQFAQSGLPGHINRCLAKCGLRPEFLTVEVTESVAMQDIESTVSRLEAISRLGVSCTLDDFGIGFSSLSYLKRMPLAKVKIDKSFIEHCTSDPRDAAIVKAIVSMAHSLKMKVVAEGIERQEQLALLRQVHCDFGQGYLVSAAEETEKFAKRLGSELSRASQSRHLEKS
jgi:diguanylate cyclase (GGDEF)-like protein/PAS domain S-box-containing protein